MPSTKQIITIAAIVVAVMVVAPMLPVVSDLPGVRKLK